MNTNKSVILDGKYRTWLIQKYRSSLKNEEKFVFSTWVRKQIDKEQLNCLHVFNKEAICEKCGVQKE